jgi:hypothetical protein
MHLPHSGRNGVSALSAFVLSLLVAALLLPGCTIRLIGEYDEVIDTGVTELQQKAEQRFATLLSQPETPYDPAVYDDLDARLAVLQSRAKTIPKYPLIVEQLVSLKAQFETLRQLDKTSARPIAKNVVTSAQSAVAVSIESILKLQTGLKRGEKPGTSKT